MRSFLSTWTCFIALSLFIFPMTTHAQFEQDVMPFDRLPCVEWNDLSADEIQWWLLSNEENEDDQDFDGENVVLVIPEGSTISLKMEIESDFFAFTAASPSEPPILRLSAKKKFFLARRGGKCWVKLEGCSWMPFEKAAKSVLEDASTDFSCIQDEYGPVLYFKAKVK